MEYGEVDAWFVSVDIRKADKNPLQEEFLRNIARQWRLNEFLNDAGLDDLGQKPGDMFVGERGDDIFFGRVAKRLPIPKYHIPIGSHVSLSPCRSGWCDGKPVFGGFSIYWMTKENYDKYDWRTPWYGVSGQAVHDIHYLRTFYDGEEFETDLGMGSNGPNLHSFGFLDREIYERGCAIVLKDIRLKSNNGKVITKGSVIRIKPQNCRVSKVTAIAHPSSDILQENPKWYKFPRNDTEKFVIRSSDMFFLIASCTN